MFTRKLIKTKFTNMPEVISKKKKKENPVCRTRKIVKINGVYFSVSAWRMNCRAGHNRERKFGSVPLTECGSALDKWRVCKWNYRFLATVLFYVIVWDILTLRFSPGDKQNFQLQPLRFMRFTYIFFLCRRERVVK